MPRVSNAWGPEVCDMSDLRDWLRKNKLEQLADWFEANDIDLDVLPDLTEQDLEKLGVSIGNRRRLLRSGLRILCRAQRLTCIPTNGIQTMRPTRPRFLSG